MVEIVNKSKGTETLIIPRDLEDIINHSKWEKNEVGMSGASIYKIKSVQGYGDCFLKISPIVDGDIYLRSEKEVYEWLEGKINVPKVIYYKEHGNYEYMLMKKIEGKDLSELISYVDKKELIRSIARELKKLHSVDISECKIDKRLMYKLSKAQHRVNNDLVDMENIEEDNKGRSAMDIFQELLIKKPSKEELVFTHGDYSLANIIIKDNKVSGLIDVGNGGLADRYVDIAIILRDLKDEKDYKELWRIFFEEYGINPDYEKINYYILLDELF